jgi:hypothetical protein
MKKTLFYFVLVIGLAASLTSCVGFFISLKVHKMVVDESVPADQTVIITFENDLNNGWFQVKEWNNEQNSKKLGEELYGKDGPWSNQKTQLTVPAGNNSFTFDVTYSFSRGYTDIDYPFKAIQLRYDLELGKEYVIKGKSKRPDSGKGYEFFVGIYDVTGKQEILLKEWKLGET